MIKRRVVLFYFILFLSQHVFSQDTILIKELDHVIITATRTENKLSNVAVPVILINKKEITNRILRTTVYQQPTKGDNKLRRCWYALLAPRCP